MHDLFFFDVADFAHYFRRFLHHLFDTLLFDVCGVDGVEDFVLQLIIEMTGFLKIVFRRSWSCKYDAFECVYGKEYFVCVFGYSCEVRVELHVSQAFISPG